MSKPITSARARTELARRELAKRNARRHLRHFVRESWHVTNPAAAFDDAWYIDVVADHVQRQIEDWAHSRGDASFAPACQDLLINIPPRCLKSTLVSVCATAWAWLDHPEMRIGCLSVNPRVSFRDALAVRALIQGEWYQRCFAPGWSLRDDQNAVGNFANTAGGSRIARGFDSNVVGEGFDWILVDDPHDPRDSEAAVNAVIMGWDVALSSRVNDARSSIRTGIMQCITEHDFSSHVRKQGWKWLCLPMEFEPDYAVPFPVPTAIGPRDVRVAGECLHPSRFPPRVLEQRKLELGSYGYAAQYQQRPAPLEGGIIKRGWFRRFTMDQLPARLDWTTLSVDATFGSVEETADNVGLLVAAGAGVNRYVLHDASRPMSFLDSIASILALLSAYPAIRRVLIEKAAAGGPIAEVLRKKLSEGAHRAIVVEEIVPRDHGSKKDRVVASLPQLEAGYVHLLDGASWVEPFVGEMGLFPNGQHDDRVDALSQLLIRYAPTGARERWRILSS